MDPKKEVALTVKPDSREPSEEIESKVTTAVAEESNNLSWVNKGSLANSFTFVFMVIGVAMRFALGDWENRSNPARYVLAFGLFGFAGGITNWIAITMLFDEIPGLAGSGIIPKQFQQIKSTMKNMIMDTFFSTEFLEKQVKDKLSKFASKDAIEGKLKGLLDSPDFETMLDTKLAEMADKPMGMMLAMLNLNASKVKPFIKPFVTSMASDLGPLIHEMLSGDGAIPVSKIRDEVENLMDERLKELTANRIKVLIEAVIREHLAWLVVWGNVFGGLIGIISELVGY